jgi:uncharacterized protein (TIGR00290 family)
MDTFLDAGFVSVVVAVKPDKLGKEWLGRTIDRQFLKEITELGDISLTGEAGEFHSLVIDGPIFKKRLEIIEAEKEFRDDRWFYAIKKVELKENRYRERKNNYFIDGGGRSGKRITPGARGEIR